VEFLVTGNSGEGNRKKTPDRL